MNEFHTILNGNIALKWSGNRKSKPLLKRLAFLLIMPWKEIFNVWILCLESDSLE
jgi:hypothetical protein